MAIQEDLFQATQTLIEANLAAIKFDKTTKATIIDDTNAENGEYRLDNGSMEFTAYSDNVTYRKGNVVYVTIPSGDVTQQKIITGKFIAGEKETATFVSPSETFMDITGNLFPKKKDRVVELTANGPKRIEVISDEIDINEIGYNRILIRCDVRTWLKSYNLLQGNYGVRVDIIEREQTTLTSSRKIPHSYYLDCKDMYGDMYNYETYYTQEILCDISNITGTIEKVSLTAYQLNNFENSQGMISCSRDIKNIFLTNFYVSFGFDLSNYNGESVLLYTPQSKTYSDQFTDKMKEYFDVNADDGPLTTSEMDGYIIRYNNKDLKIRWLIQDAADSAYPIKAVSSFRNVPEGTAIHVYRWNLSNDVSDEIAGAFWEEITEYKNNFEISGFVPDSSKAFEKLKVVIESPSNAFMRSKLEADQDYIQLMTMDQNNADVQQQMKSLENEYLSQVVYYTSNELEFTNESDVVDYTSLDLITGLTIDVDVNGYNGIYMLYEDSGEIAATSEASKRRVLSANYTSLVSGDSAADAAEKITWVIPLVNTMIVAPEYGVEFDAVMDKNPVPGTNIYKSLRGSDEVVIYEDRIEITRTGVTPTVGMGEYEDGSAAQIFRIKSQFNPNYTNNTIECRLVKNRKTYSAVATLSFGPKGIQGTDYSFCLQFENGETALPLVEGYEAIVQPKIYNADHTDISELYKDATFEWSWYNRIVRQDKIADEGIIIVKDNMTEQRIKLRVQKADWDACSFYILKCTVKGMVPLANTASSQKLTLTTYLPIAIKPKGFNRLAIDGPVNIKYDTTGTNPQFYNKNYELQSNLTTIDGSGNPTIVKYPIGWRMVFGADCEGAEGDAYKFYPHVSEDGKLTVPSLFLTSGMGTQIMVEGYINPHSDTVTQENGKNVVTRTYYDNWSYDNYVLSVDNEGNMASRNVPVTYAKGTVLWRQPLRIFIEKYGSPLLNSWDGNLTIDEENGIILSAMMGAGIKNTDNSFSGVLMGDVSQAFKQSATGTLSKYYNGIGLYGYDGGVQSFGLNVNGKAFFGASGHGQILIDGTSGEITSANYRINDCGLNLDLDDGVLTAKGPVITTDGKKTQSMVLIDPQAGGDYDSRPFFRISDHLGHDLMKVGYGVYKLQNSLYDEGKVGMQLDFNKGTLKAKSESGKDDAGRDYKSSFVMIDGSGDSGAFLRIYDGKAQKDIFYAGGSQLRSVAGTRKITDSDTISVKTDAEAQKVMNENISNPVRSAKTPNVTRSVKPNKIEDNIAIITIVVTSREQDDYTGGSIKYPVTTDSDQVGKLESIVQSECKISKWKTLTTTYTIKIDMNKIKSIDLGEGAVLDLRKPFCRAQIKDLEDKTVYGQDVVKDNPDKIIALTNRDGLTNTSETEDSGTNFTIRHTYYKKTSITDVKNGTFFLQSSNYGGNESEEVNRLGMKIDLSEGSLAVYDKNATGGYVKLSSNASEFLKVVCVKDGNSSTILVAGESQYYLKSFDYGGPEIDENATITDETGTHTVREVTKVGSGLKIDLRENTIEGYNVLIHTRNGSDTSKYIKIDSKAPTYPLRIGSKFRVNWDGDIYAKDGYFVDGHFSGVLESNAGHIGGFLITSSGIFTTTDGENANGLMSLYSSGSISLGDGNMILDSTGGLNAGHDAIRISGAGKYMLIGTGGEMQFNGATGNAAFSGGLAIGGDMLVAGTITDADLTEADDNGLTFATASATPQWYINKTDGVVVQKGKIGGWSITAGHIKSAGSKIDLSSASGAEYLKVGSLALSSSAINFKAGSLITDGTTDDKIYYSGSTIILQAEGGVELQGYAAHAGAYYKFPMSGAVSFNAISSFALKYDGGTQLSISSDDAAILKKIFNKLTETDIENLKTFLNNINGKTFGSTTLISQISTGGSVTGYSSSAGSHTHEYYKGTAATTKSDTSEDGSHQHEVNYNTKTIYGWT